ncbi:uncharacterized protein LOC142527587 isoform X1 [Primulina tabacum]|uniref:uncharacterized protein LOC142527587 isoform X1 n=1 Tax=Primulina tabacum TaxID=48773 RepID=UPI003F599CD5
MLTVNVHSKLSLMAAPASSPSSASNSQVSAAHSSLAKVEPPPDESKEIMGSEEQRKEPIKDPIDILEGDEYMEKLQRYEADYKQYLMSKYFTDKTIFGGNIFDVKMNIDGHTTYSSEVQRVLNAFKIFLHLLLY